MDLSNESRRDILWQAKFYSKALWHILLRQYRTYRQKKKRLCKRQSINQSINQSKHNLLLKHVGHIKTSVVRYENKVKY